MIGLGLARAPTRLPLKVEQETYRDSDDRSSESNRCHSIIQSLNAHRTVTLRVSIERMFWTVGENIRLSFDILLTERNKAQASVILSVTIRSSRCFPRLLSRKEDLSACCRSRAVSLRRLALELMETSASYSASLGKDPYPLRHCVRGSTPEL